MTTVPGKLKDASFKDTEVIVQDLTKASPDFKNAQFYPVASDKDEFFVRAILQKPRQNKKVPVLVAFDKKGKELRRYEGMEGSRKGFCVTDKYVIFANPAGNFRVFEKKRAKGKSSSASSLSPRSRATASSPMTTAGRSSIESISKKV